MVERQADYELAPTTERSADRIAKAHGYGGFSQFAHSLPQGAKVLDVGSGASPFGRKVAALRPDISWTNFDYSYHDPAILEDISQDAPSNLQYIAGDATHLDQVFEPESFDAVFSYWMVPHLSLDDPQPARTAVRSMFDLTKKDGVISVGPKLSFKDKTALAPGKSYRIVKDDSVNEGSFVDTVVDLTKMRGVSRRLQKRANEIIIPTLGTTRWKKRKGTLTYVYHSGSGDYVYQYSPKGLQTLGKLAIAQLVNRPSVENDPKESRRKLSGNAKVALGTAGVSLVSILGLQVTHDQENRPQQPTIELIDPLTWLATPISNAINDVDGHHIQYRSRGTHSNP